uniref:dentin sialophosphoprotein-like n=1 Tax=Doryrhamphus excisus TaxID=161450 RepID=UPI0025ADC075|nr:dentin sialophosphoprotein-like [Doryrhamphus excisus]
MDGQGDGDHNGPNRHHIYIPTEEHPPNGDNNDIEFILLLHFIINHHMRVFRQNQIGFINENVNVNIVNHADMNSIPENHDEVDSDVEADVDMEVDEVMEGDEGEEGEPQPGPSSRTRDGHTEQEEEQTRNRKCSRWWHEFDNTSDSSVDLDNEEEPLLGRSEERSRADSEDTSPQCGHELAENISDLAEDGATRNCLPEPSGTSSTDTGEHQCESRGNKSFHWWYGVEGNSSDSGTDLDVVEETPKIKSSNDVDSGEEKGQKESKWQDNRPAMCNCAPTQSTEDTVVAEEVQASTEGESCSAQEAEEHPAPGPSRMR